MKPYTIVMLVLLIFTPHLAPGEGGGMNTRSGETIVIDSDEELLAAASLLGWGGNGSPGSPVVIEGLNISAGSNPNCLFIGNTTLHVVIRSLVVRNARIGNNIMALGSGIGLYRAENVSVSDVLSVDNKGYGISVIGCSNISIDASDLRSNGRSGLFIQNSESVRVMNVSVDGSGTDGIDLQSSHDVLIDSCSSSSAVNSAMLMRGSTRTVTIVNSSFSDSIFGIATSEDIEDVLIRSCDSYENTHGMYLTGSRDLTISGCGIEDNRDSGIHGSNIRELILEGSSIRNCSSGLDFKNVTSSMITDNELTGNYLGIFLSGPSANNLISANLIASSSFLAVRVLDGKDMHFSNNSFIYNTGTGDRLDPIVRQVSTGPDSIDSSPLARSPWSIIREPDHVSAGPIKGGVRISWEPVADAAEYRVFRSDGPFDPPRELATVRNTTFEDLSLKNEDVHHYTICSLNGDLLPGDVTTAVPARGDLFGPIVNITHPVENSYMDVYDLTASWNSSDRVTSVSGSLLVIDGQNVSGIPIEGEYTLRGITEGPHELTIISWDENGNRGEDDVNFIVDRTPPMVRIISPENGTITNAKRIVFRWESDDRISPLNGTIYSLDGGEAVSTEENTTGFAGLEEGRHTFNLSVRDLAGNEWMGSVSFTVDRTPPHVLTAEPSGVINDLDRMIRVSLDEEIDFSTVRMEVEDHPGIVQWFGDSIYYRMFGGLDWGQTYVVNLEVKDLAGNPMLFSWNFSTVKDVGTLKLVLIDHIGYALANVDIIENGTVLGTSDDEGVISIVIASGSHTLWLNGTGLRNISVFADVPRQGTLNLGTITMERLRREGGTRVIFLVTDRRGNLIKGADIYLNGTFEGRTDRNGTFALTLDADSYDVRAVFEGLSSKGMSLNVLVSEEPIMITLVVEEPSPEEEDGIPRVLIWIPIVCFIIALIGTVFIYSMRNERAERRMKEEPEEGPEDRGPPEDRRTADRLGGLDERRMP